MIENISRTSSGAAPMEAALKGAEEIGFTILSLSVSLHRGTDSLLFMGDVVGRCSGVCRDTGRHDRHFGGGLP